MFNKFIMMVFLGAPTGGDPTDVSQTIFPYRAECDYAAEQINEKVPGAIAFCFDVQVMGDRHEGGSPDLPQIAPGAAPALPQAPKAPVVTPKDERAI